MRFTDPRLEQVADALDLQHEFMLSEAVLIGADGERHADYTDCDPSYTTCRWRMERKIFSVRYRGKEFYPAFQFDDAGQPYRLMKTLIEIFEQDQEMTEWDIAVWFTTANGFLSGEIPKTLLSIHSKDAEQRLVNAAEQEVAPAESPRSSLGSFS